MTVRILRLVKELELQQGIYLCDNEVILLKSYCRADIRGSFINSGKFIFNDHF